MTALTPNTPWLCDTPWDAILFTNDPYKYVWVCEWSNWWSNSTKCVVNELYCWDTIPGWDEDCDVGPDGGRNCTDDCQDIDPPSTNGGGPVVWPVGWCGDGDLDDTTEECDDGNNVDSDGCNSNCQIETVDCGNGVLNTGEQCDDNNNIAWDGCSSICEIECGNWVIDIILNDDGQIEGQEWCDDNNAISWDWCSSTCMLEYEPNTLLEFDSDDESEDEDEDEPTPVCGNNIVEEWEQCDDNNTDNWDGCSDTCQFEGDTLCVQLEVISWQAEPEEFMLQINADTWPGASLCIPASDTDDPSTFVAGAAVIDWYEIESYAGDCSEQWVFAAIPGTCVISVIQSHCYADADIQCASPDSFVDIPTNSGVTYDMIEYVQTACIFDWPADNQQVFNGNDPATREAVFKVAARLMWLPEWWIVAPSSQVQFEIYYNAVIWSLVEAGVMNINDYAPDGWWTLLSLINSYQWQDNVPDFLWTATAFSAIMLMHEILEYKQVSEWVIDLTVADMLSELLPNGENTENPVVINRYGLLVSAYDSLLAINTDSPLPMCEQAETFFNWIHLTREFIYEEVLGIDDPLTLGAAPTDFVVPTLPFDDSLNYDESQATAGSYDAIQGQLDDDVDVDAAYTTIPSDNQWLLDLITGW